jgi:uncharacterized protein
MTDAATASKSPCTKVCAVHPTLSICIGCGRSLDEIARWIALSEAERTAIMAQLPARLAAIGGAKAATA